MTEMEDEMSLNSKTAVTLTKPTVGRRSVGLIGRQSGDSRPNFVPDFNCFLVGPLQKNYN